MYEEDRDNREHDSEADLAMTRTDEHMEYRRSIPQEENPEIQKRGSI